MNVNDVLQAIAKFENLDPLDIHAYDQAVDIFRSLKRFPVIIHTLQVQELVVYRTRTHNDDILFTELSQIINPPAEYVKSFGRCNTLNQSKFYASENRPTSYLELVNYLVSTKKVGEIVFATVGRWLVKSPVRTLIIVSPNLEQRTSEFDKFHGKNFDQIISKYDNPTQEACIVFYSYLADLFRQAANKNPRLYYITSAYCNLVLKHHGKEFDAVYYPSVAYEGKGVNFAFNEDFIGDLDVQLLDVLRSTFVINQNEDGFKNFLEIDQKLSHPFDPEINVIKW